MTGHVKSLDERARALAQQALGSGHVTFAARQVAEYAIRAAGLCIPIAQVQGALRRILAERDLVLVPRGALVELYQAAQAHKMFDRYPTDSLTLQRFKRAIHEVRTLTITDPPISTTEAKGLDEFKP